MSDTTLLTVGYVLVTVLYVGYWLTLKLRLARAKQKRGN